LKSLDAIAETNPDVAPVGDATTAPAPTDVGQPGANGYQSDVVVLLTDGANTRGITPLDAVPYAIQRGVRVYTIGFGTATPARMSCSRAQLGAGAIGSNNGGGGFGGGGFGGGGARGGAGTFGGAGSPLVADDSTLQKVADQTGGKFYKAEDAEQLGKVFTELPQDVDLQEEQTEISAVFAGLGALLAAAAVVASARWSPYP
jgi:Ca-activated chloride channel family protein